MTGPSGFPDDERPEYALAEIKHWLQVFAQRFFAFSQFKRSALPNGPKVSAGGSLSPRGDWRAPVGHVGADLAGGPGVRARRVSRRPADQPGAHSLSASPASSRPR